MLRLFVDSVHVAPASSDLNKPPLSFSMSAYTRFPSAGETATPMRPNTPDGRPDARLISVHVSPPSVDLNNPLPGPPLDIWYSTRYASHRPANITLGLRRSIAMSIPPVLLSRKSTFFQVLPPSVVLKMPRSSLGAP